MERTVTAEVLSSSDLREERQNERKPSVPRMDLNIGLISLGLVSSRPSDERHTTGWAYYDTDHKRPM
jgi:hypothetical protein